MKHHFFTIEKAIYKRSFHIQASIIIKIITQVLFSKNYHSAHHIIISAISQILFTSFHFNALIIADIINIKFIQEGFFDALNEIKKRFKDLKSSIMIIIINIL